MKKIKLLAFLTIAISSHSIDAFHEDQINSQANTQTHDDTNRQKFHDALTIAINLRQQGSTNILTITPITLPFTKAQLIAWREDYERLHPGVFQANPAIITATHEGLVQIRVFSREEADALMAQTRQNN